MGSGLERSNKRPYEDTGYSSDGSEPGANLLILAGGHNRHNDRSQPERRQTSGLVPIASLLNPLDDSSNWLHQDEEYSSGSEQRRLGQPPTSVEMPLEHTDRGTLRQQPLDNPLAHPEQFGIQRSDAGTASGDARITDTHTNFPPEFVRNGIHAIWKNMRIDEKLSYLINERASHLKNDYNEYWQSRNEGRFDALSPDKRDKLIEANRRYRAVLATAEADIGLETVGGNTRIADTHTKIPPEVTTDGIHAAWTNMSRYEKLRYLMERRASQLENDYNEYWQSRNEGRFDALSPDKQNKLIEANRKYRAVLAEVEADIGPETVGGDARVANLDTKFPDEVVQDGKQKEWMNMAEKEKRSYLMKKRSGDVLHDYKQYLDAVGTLNPDGSTILERLPPEEQNRLRDVNREYHKIREQVIAEINKEEEVKKSKKNKSEKDTKRRADNALRLIDFLYKTKGIEIGKRRVKTDKMESTIINKAQKSGKLSVHAAKRLVVQWRAKAREWEAKQNNPDPDDPYLTTDVED